MSSDLYSSYFIKKYKEEDNIFFIISNKIIEEIKGKILNNYFNPIKIHRIILKNIDKYGDVYHNNNNNINTNNLKKYIIECLILILVDNKQYIKGLDLYNYYNKLYKYNEELSYNLYNLGLYNYINIYNNDKIKESLKEFIKTIYKGDKFNDYINEILISVNHFINHKNYMRNKRLFINDINRIGIFERFEVLTLLSLYYYYSSFTIRTHYKYCRYIFNILKQNLDYYNNKLFFNLDNIIYFHP